MSAKVGEKYCKSHLNKFLKYGDPLWERKYVCSVDGCNDPIRAKGLCRNHYWVVHENKSIKVMSRIVAINQMIKDPAWDDLLRLYSEEKELQKNR